MQRINNFKLKLFPLGFASALTLSGCAIAPEKISIAEQLNDLQVDASIIAGEQVLAIHDLTFEQAIARAIKFNRERRVALMESVLLQKELDNTYFDMLPKLALSAGYQARDKLAASSSGVYDTDEDQVSTTNPPTYSVSSAKESHSNDVGMTWNILDFGLSYVRAKQYSDRVLISKERERKALQNLTQEVRTAYWKALSAQRLIKKVLPLTKRVDAALLDSRTIESLRLRSPIESLNYQRELLDIRRSLESLQKDLVAARTQLAVLIGHNPSAELHLSEAQNGDYIVPELRLNLETLEKMALALRPELNEANYQKRITHQEGKAALFALLPNLNINITSAYDSNEYLLNNQWNNYGASVSLNLLNAYKYPTNKSAITARQTLNDERRLALIAAVMSQVHLAKINYEQAKQAFATASAYSTVVSRIGEHMAAMKKQEQIGELQLVREDLSAVLAELRRDVAYAELQSSYGTIYATAGLDPIAKSLSGNSIEEIASAVKKQFENWAEGKFDAVAIPLSEQFSQWEGEGHKQVIFDKNSFLLAGDVDYEAKLKEGGPLPFWLQWEPTYLQLSGNPPLLAAPLEVTITATTANGTQMQDSFELTAVETNDAPQVTNNPVVTVIEGQNEVTGLFEITEVDGDAYTVSLDTNRQILTQLLQVKPNGEWRFDASHSSVLRLTSTESEEFVFPIKVIDEHGLTTYFDFSIFVEGKNNRPVFTQDFNTTVIEGTSPIEGQLIVSNFDGGSSLKYRAIHDPGYESGFSISSNGAWRFDPQVVKYTHLNSGDLMTVVARIEVSDEEGQSDQTNMTFNIKGTDTAPRALSAQRLFVELNQENNFTKLLPQLFIDPDSPTLKYLVKEKAGLFGKLRPLPSWLGFDESKMILFLQENIDSEKVKSTRIVIEAQDQSGSKATQEIQVTYVPGS